MHKNMIPGKRMNPALAAMSRRARDNSLISAAGKANKIITLMVLHDKFDFTQDQIQEFINAYQAELDAYNQGYVESVKDFTEVLKNECGIEIDV